uniref:Uncharacterized protein n=1 Tax=Heliothis virescens TaxID=7102 RepID=A0A2A4J802_HELVI
MTAPTRRVRAHAGAHLRTCALHFAFDVPPSCRARVGRTSAAAARRCARSRLAALLRTALSDPGRDSARRAGRGGGGLAGGGGGPPARRARREVLCAAADPQSSSTASPVQDVSGRARLALLAVLQPAWTASTTTSRWWANCVGKRNFTVLLHVRGCRWSFLAVSMLRCAVTHVARWRVGAGWRPRCAPAASAVVAACAFLSVPPCWIVSGGWPASTPYLPPRPDHQRGHQGFFFLTPLACLIRNRYSRGNACGQLLSNVAGAARFAPKPHRPVRDECRPAPRPAFPGVSSLCVLAGAESSTSTRERTSCRPSFVRAVSAAAPPAPAGAARARAAGRQLHQPVEGGYMKPPSLDRDPCPLQATPEPRRPRSPAAFALGAPPAPAPAA